MRQIEIWQKKLKPGTMLWKRRILPPRENVDTVIIDGGMFLVYHTQVEVFPGPSTLLHIWTLSSRECKLKKLEVESSTFQQLWTIVDVESCSADPAVSTAG